MFTLKYLLILIPLSKFLMGYCLKSAMFEVKKGHKVNMEFLMTLKNAGRLNVIGKK